jgi:hypothetical protein
MNTPTGIQVPQTLLPAINEMLNQDDLIVMLVHPGTDRITVEDHWSRLQQELEGVAVFRDKRGEVETHEDFHMWIGNMRRSRHRRTRPTFILYSFSQRFSQMEMESDVSFHYFPGSWQVNLQRGKLRARDVVPGPKVLELPRVDKRAYPSDIGKIPPRLQIHISGDRAQDGKSTLALDLREFLRERYPDLAIEHYCAELNLEAWEHDSEGKRKLNASVIQIVDGNERAKPQSKLGEMHVRHYTAKSEIK